jgi:hypothetical protein
MAENGRSAAEARRADAALAAGIAVGKSIREAAAAAGVSERTAHRRVKAEAFRTLVREIREAMADAAWGVASEGLVEAARTLREALQKASWAVKVRAASALVDMASHLEGADLDARLAEMEEIVKSGTWPGASDTFPRVAGG